MNKVKLKQDIDNIVRKNIKETEILADRFEEECKQDIVGSDEYINDYGMMKFYKGQLRGLRMTFVFLQCIDWMDGDHNGVE